MNEIKISLLFNFMPSQAYDFLRQWHHSERIKLTSLLTLGFSEMMIFCYADVKNERLYFRAPGRDFSGKCFGDWTWGYEFIVTSQNQTQVTIWYKWGTLLSLFALKKVKNQASHAIIASVFALEALEWRIGNIDGSAVFTENIIQPRKPGLNTNLDSQSIDVIDIEIK